MRTLILIPLALWLISVPAAADTASSAISCVAQASAPDCSALDQCWIDTDAAASLQLKICTAVDPDVWTTQGRVMANDSVTPDDVLSSGQTDEYCLTYEETGDTWQWTWCGGGGTEANDLEEHAPPSIEDNEIYVGTGSGAGSFIALQDCADGTHSLDWNGSAFECIANSSGGAGDIEAIGDCAAGAAFTGECGTLLQSNASLTFESDADDNVTHDKAVEKIDFDLTGDGISDIRMEIEGKANWGNWDYSQISWPTTDGGYDNGNDDTIRISVGTGALNGPAAPGACSEPATCWRNNMFGIGYNKYTTGGGAIVPFEHAVNWTWEYDYLTALGGDHLVENNINFHEATWCTTWNGSTCTTLATGAAFTWRPYGMNINMGPDGNGPSDASFGWTSAYWPSNRYSMYSRDWGLIVNYDVGNFNPRAKFNIYEGDTITSDPVGNAYTGMYMQYKPTWDGNPTQGHVIGGAFMEVAPKFNFGYTANNPLAGTSIQVAVDSIDGAANVGNVAGMNLEVGMRNANNGWTHDNGMFGLRVMMMPTAFGTPTGYTLPFMAGIQVERRTMTGANSSVENYYGYYADDQKCDDSGVDNCHVFFMARQNGDNLTGAKGNIKFHGTWGKGHIHAGGDSQAGSHLFVGNAGQDHHWRWTAAAAPTANNSGERVYNPKTDDDRGVVVWSDNNDNSFDSGNEVCGDRGLSCQWIQLQGTTYSAPAADCSTNQNQSFTAWCGAKND